MKTKVLIAVLIIGALLCSGIVGADKPAKETVQKVKFVHYKDDSSDAKEKTPTASPNANPKSVKTPKPTPTATPTEFITPEPTGTAIPEPTKTATPTSTETPTATVTASPTATPTPIQSDLYKLMGVKWNQYPARFYVNPSWSGLDAGAVTDEVLAALGTWDAEVGVDLATYAGATETAMNNNGRSEIYWTPISDTRIIATTTAFFTSSGIFEADIQMNSLLPWGIDTDGEGTQFTLTDRFDVRNIATHEAGHAFGLNDLYESSAADLTMYGYSTRGQTKKISLGYGDILGIQSLYRA